MVPCPKCSRHTTVREEPLLLDSTALREALAETPMCRHSNPVAPQERCRGCREDWGLILAALEQQNVLLTELLGAVTGLTAACLCRVKESS